MGYKATETPLKVYKLIPSYLTIHTKPEWFPSQLFAIKTYLLAICATFYTGPLYTYLDPINHHDEQAKGMQAL